MSNNYIIGTSNLSENIVNKLSEYLDFKGCEWWHWLECFWIISDHLSTINFEDLKQKIKSLVKDDSYLVMRIDNIRDWYFEGSHVDKNAFAWLQNNIFTQNSDIESSSIIRSIEFPQEYYYAGISILNYFGTVLKNKYPEKQTKVRIEQDGLNVKMIIKTPKGNHELIEKTLSEYGLVVTGQMPIDEFSDNRLLIEELKAELRLAQVRIESQKELLEYKNAEAEKFYKLLDQALQKPFNIDNYNTFKTNNYSNKTGFDQKKRTDVDEIKKIENQQKRLESDLKTSNMPEEDDPYEI